MASKRSLPVTIVDAFTDKPFAGNPAAVCVLKTNGPNVNTEEMQKIAREMSLSETAFVTATADDAVFGLRWFTPTVEVPLCGHATLASAHALFTERGASGPATLHFDTLSGRLSVTRLAESGELQMDFPLGKGAPVELKPAAVASLRRALNIADADGPTDVWFCAPTRKLMLTVTSTAVIDGLRLDAPTLLATDFGGLDARGVIVTTRGGEGAYAEYDFISRYFAPANGIAEDPVTGSAHTVLAPYWSAKLGKTEMRAFQASPGRGGALGIGLRGDGRVLLTGRAVTVLRGTLEF
eukprot:TRINITY_DN1741_c0_g2_i1.p1 TRINITY_DN1741_c0_g2~~TRINITY_DN1741_c0_g2_i1.p1  ORF type:complete len:295 (+),score=68.08 TRINITY_DN1741_c0_g2_i1:49-933(+)